MIAFMKPRMINSRHVALTVGLVSMLLIVRALPVHSLDHSRFILQLEKALNTSGDSSLENLLGRKFAIEQIGRYNKFMASFPKAIWFVQKSNPLKNGSPTIEILVRGRKISGSHNYVLDAKQRVALKITGEQIIGQKVIEEQSILKTTTKPIPITLQIPDAVLTGSRYDVDVVVDEPLGDSMIAAGLIGLTPYQLKNQLRPAIELSPMGGGGLYKSVKAPMNPGMQTWAALLAHPDGLISITKSVRVVSDESNLIP